MVEKNKLVNRSVNLGSVEKIPLGQGFCFVVGKEEIAVFRPRSGGLFALQNRCPHRNAPLCEGIIDNHHVICPYHARKFEFRTGVGSEKGESVQVYDVCVENGDIVLSKCPDANHVST
ncbi:MAG: nitrite reductase (NAD(P)H) small subunit [Deltaproteobacteria bacterium]|nr:nitrite reductase (NAD(P)H) small subunit [Deltaproteobacteria bacterium]